MMYVKLLRVIIVWFSEQTLNILFAPSTRRPHWKMFTGVLARSCSGAAGSDAGAPTATAALTSELRLRGPGANTPDTKYRPAGKVERGRL